jgi:hypothetical protein
MIDRSIDQQINATCRPMIMGDFYSVLDPKHKVKKITEN